MIVKKFILFHPAVKLSFLLNEQISNSPSIISPGGEKYQVKNYIQFQDAKQH